MSGENGPVDSYTSDEFDDADQGRPAQLATSSTIRGQHGGDVTKPTVALGNRSHLSKKTNHLASPGVRRRVHGYLRYDRVGNREPENELALVKRQLRSEQKVCQRLRMAVEGRTSFIDRSQEQDNQIKDLQRQLKDSQGEIKTLQQVVRRAKFDLTNVQEQQEVLPDQMRTISKEVRHWKERCNELSMQYREDQRNIRTQHDKIIMLQGQLHKSPLPKTTEKSDAKSDERRQEIELTLRQQLVDIKSIAHQEQRRARRLIQRLESERAELRDELQHCQQLIQEKDGKLSAANERIDSLHRRITHASRVPVPSIFTQGGSMTDREVDNGDKKGRLTISTCVTHRDEEHEQEL